MLKKIVSLVIILTIITTVGIPAYAQKKDDGILKELNKLEKKYGVEFFEITESNDYNLISVSNLDEIKSALNQLKKDIKKEKAKMNTAEVLKVNKSRYTIMSLNGSYKWTWWAPFSGWGITGGYTWKNISHNHSYGWLNENPYFIDCRNINSWISGINVAVGWVQQNSYFNIRSVINYHDTITNTVSGYWYLGFDFNGFTVGARINDTWPTKSLRIVY